MWSLPKVVGKMIIYFIMGSIDTIYKKTPQLVPVTTINLWNTIILTSFITWIHYTLIHPLNHLFLSLSLQVETEDRVPAMFERIEHTAQLYTYISMRSLDSNGERTSCYVGFDSSHHGICTTPNERKYFLENTPYNNIGWFNYVIGLICGLSERH